jgi:hypothetical protein
MPSTSGLKYWQKLERKTSKMLAGLKPTRLRRAAQLQNFRAMGEKG